MTDGSWGIWFAPDWDEDKDMEADRYWNSELQRWEYPGDERYEIVAWLRGLTGADRMMMPSTIADAIERGDHLNTQVSV